MRRARCLRRSYLNNRIKKCFEDPARLQRKIPFEWARTIKKRLDHLDAADDFGAFLSLGLGRPHPLEGYPGRCWGLHVTGNVRLVVCIRPEDVTVAQCTEYEIRGACDYHEGKENWYVS